MKAHRAWIIAGGCLLVMLVSSIRGITQDETGAQSAEVQHIFITQAERMVAGGEPDVRFHMAQGGVPTALGMDFTIGFVGLMGGFGGKTVQGAPYSAEAVTEIVQRLFDGNRIIRKTTASVYRDSEGRTRREQSLGTIGPWVAAGELPQTTFINDPVAGTQHVLNPRSRTARKMPAPRPVDFRVSGTWTESVGINRTISRDGVPGIPVGPEGYNRIIDHHAPSRAQTESLGNRLIEGVEAEGTRSTVTIPAGEIGNELPIEIVSERWYSPELQTVVLSMRNDPRFGETIYRLVNISRSEPLSSLFEVPFDYNIQEWPAALREYHSFPARPVPAQE